MEVDVLEMMMKKLESHSPFMFKVLLDSVNPADYMTRGLNLAPNVNECDQATGCIRMLAAGLISTSQPRQEKSVNDGSLAL